MSLFDRVASLRRRAETMGGVATATVVDHADPEGAGRVMVDLGTKFAAGRLWARTATLMAGPERGTWFVPDVGDEVLVAFEHGDPRRPVVVGSLWNHRSRPPEEVGADNGRRSIVTRSGARIMIDDTGGRCVVHLETAGGRYVTLDDGPPRAITVADADGSSITIEPSGVEVRSPSKLTLTAAIVAISASRVELKAAMVDAAGVVKCDTMIASNVVASSYTPGVGNIS
ncbi:MAG TPA: phage baseplate assembly protein V [Acidimicrobiia bacterium]|nr:phage baseplate assembly protein V [Acidimicrobiia bacterium]